MEAKIIEEPKYILTLNQAEAKYIKALLNIAPSDLAKGVLEGKYTASQICDITNHSSEKSMWSVMNQVI